ncbi:hypothetical protein COY90_05335 [Candidatus Roizmanbacteria bacterium CG_4_10_14_0_8_um_filter_39_9]|uniref:Uncharacterized protein n=1 Tax=Candidatus Roizmanbacteria bacterium CG_4_10_14_0_8_um_filter_39_9 TaxID=1974829 RepID=A0A2M7QCF8_9BACT|nr:MAG: hypothetical protein COY90_05335 [Candidatus Roizmanbacteria bacterium CG_4_10_14_0_8_um_filter_39_9]
MTAIKEHPQKHGEFKYPSEPFQKASTYWKEQSTNPQVLVQNHRQYGTAFGNGATLLGSENEFSTEVKNKLIDRKTTIAGVEFSEDELTWIGQYYDGLNEELGMKGRCMDERIDENKGTSGIHGQCGAAAATGAVIGKTGVEVEDIAMRLTGENHKTGLIEGLHHHEALTVMVTFGKQPYSLDTARYAEARANAALPFHTFIDVEEVDAFAKTNGLNRVDVFNALLKWNPQIAINIMIGNHNHYSNTAKSKGVIALLDTRGVNKTQYADMFEAAQAFFSAQTTKITQIEI